MFGRQGALLACRSLVLPRFQREEVHLLITLVSVTAVSSRFLDREGYEAERAI